MRFDWASFRQSLLVALEAGNLSVTLHDGAQADASRDDVLVGVGKPMEDAGPHRVVLNNKGQAERYSSVARLMAAFPTRVVKRWALWQEATARDPASVLPRLRLVVEDASPDSVIGVVYLLARVAGAEAADLPAPWTAAADRWECTGDAQDPYRSWAPLCAALGHCHFLTQGQASQPSKEDGVKPDSDDPDAAAERRRLTDDDLRHAWTRCLRLTAEAIAAAYSPESLPTEGLTDFAEAWAAVEAEHNSYRMALDHARKVQLYLPMSSNPQRRVLIDGIIFIEDEPAGVKKLFVRRDRENAPLGRGFTFMAVYRGAPELLGSGNDVVLSLDTARRLTLAELWTALEAGETRAWGDGRPKDQPRRDMTNPVANNSAVNQPWYITSDGSLIAAPRWVAVKGVKTPGRKLHWPEILDTIWDTYDPARFITVLPPAHGAAPVPLRACQGVATHGKNLIIARYAPPAALGTAAEEREPPALILSLTVRQTLAAMLRPGASQDKIRLETLPAPASFDVVDMPGGHAIVSNHGCFLFDDWNTPALDEVGCRAEVEHAAQLAQDLTHSRRRLQALGKQADRFLKDHKTEHPETILREVSQLKVELAGHRIALATPPEHNYLRALRARLDDRFGTAQMLAELQAQARDIEESIRSLQTARSQKYFDLFALYATPIFILVSLTSPIQNALQGWFHLNKGWSLPIWIVLALLAIGFGRLLYCMLMRAGSRKAS